MLAELADRALNVVGLADPSISIRFPKLWAQANTEILRLHPLSQQISEQLAYSLSKADCPKNKPTKWCASRRVIRRHCMSFCWGTRSTQRPLSIRNQHTHLCRFPCCRATTHGPCSERHQASVRDESVRLILGEPRASDRLARALAVLSEQEWIIPQRSSRYPGCQGISIPPSDRAGVSALIHPEERLIVTERMEEFYACHFRSR